MADITPGSGREGRIVAEYKARRARLGHGDNHCGIGCCVDERELAVQVNDIWLDMARKYKCPVRELKDIVNAYKAQKRAAVPCTGAWRCEAESHAEGCGTTWVWT